ncbi:hypothetical protein FACS1894137_18960 [Spirochaetia bacterium]|nr:hypothetical protein FACS1894137_18960 [Spirochaetia bacterium]
MKNNKVVLLGLLCSMVMVGFFVTSCTSDGWAAFADGWNASAGNSYASQQTSNDVASSSQTSNYTVTIVYRYKNAFGQADLNREGGLLTYNISAYSSNDVSDKARSRFESEHPELVFMGLSF